MDFGPFNLRAYIQARCSGLLYSTLKLSYFIEIKVMNPENLDGFCDDEPEPKRWPESKSSLWTNAPGRILMIDC